MRRCFVLALAVLSVASLVSAADWPQFRGPGGIGVALKEKGLPASWSDTENLIWKKDLPGPGASSPVVVGERVFLTCYSGYGLPKSKGSKDGDVKDLKRHLLCFDRSGKPLWQKEIAATTADYAYGGFQALHGYASSTPASDGKNVFCFFGVAGVLAFDLDGKELWRQSVGTGTHGWGSGTSPVLYNDLVIVNASVESRSIVALDKATGKVRWTAKGANSSWNTPLLVKAGARDELVFSVIGKVRAIDPASGKDLWSCAAMNDYICPSVIPFDGAVFAIGGRGYDGVAVKTGGTGDVSKTHRLWEVAKGSNVSSPVYHDGHFYWAHDGRGVVYCASAKDGSIVYEKEFEPRSDRIYASATLADGKIYFVSRTSGVYVVDASPTFKQLAHHRLADKSVFNASPAIVDGRIYLRSDDALYCIGVK